MLGLVLAGFVCFRVIVIFPSHRPVEDARAKPLIDGHNIKTGSKDRPNPASATDVSARLLLLVRVQLDP